MPDFREKPLKIEKSCPFESAHTRLRQAHDLWHRLVESYPDPDEFVLILNHVLVTLRQVTFMVQKQKGKIAGFDTWYAAWRDLMRTDPVMVWLKDARNTVEKQGDLDLASTARVEIIASWLPGPYSEFEVSPLTAPSELASSFPSDELPEYLRKEGVLRVERRWVSKNFQDQELTEVVAHGYGVLATFLADAHKQVGLQMRTFGGETHGGPHVRVEHLGGRLPCMVVADEDRTAFVSLNTGELIEHETRESELTFDEAEAAWYQERSDAMTVGGGALAPLEGEDPLDFGARWMSVARRVLAHDGYHSPSAFLFTRDLEPLKAIGMDYEGQAQKYLAFRKLARDVDRLGADVVIFIDEVWMAPADPNLTQRASERTDRQEALATVVAVSDARSRTYYSPFTRDKHGKPVLQPVITVDADRQWMLSFEPLQAVWARWRA